MLNDHVSYSFSEGLTNQDDANIITRYHPAEALLKLLVSGVLIADHIVLLSVLAPLADACQEEACDG